MHVDDLRRRLHEGLVIPAHPLALDMHRRLDEPHQAALTRYYRASGAGGLAVGVHTTQFAIRNPKIGLFEPVLALAARVAREPMNDQRTPVLVAGICGDTAQATREAELASRLEYDAGLVSLAAPDPDRPSSHRHARGPLTTAGDSAALRCAAPQPLSRKFSNRSGARSPLT